MPSKLFLSHTDANLFLTLISIFHLFLTDLSMRLHYHSHALVIFVLADTESPGVALFLLLDIPLLLEFDGRVAALCGSEFLLRLVEREQH
jgi:hypothetical protein